MLHRPVEPAPLLGRNGASARVTSCSSDMLRLQLHQPGGLDDAIDDAIRSPRGISATLSTDCDLVRYIGVRGPLHWFRSPGI